MKRILALLLALVMVCALAACGGNKDAGTDANTGAETNTDANIGTDEDAGASIEGGTDGETAGNAVEEVAVMTHDEYEAAALETQVVVETYVQATQGWWEEEGVGMSTIYAQSEDGAYFIYKVACTAEQYEQISTGTKIRVTGYKAEWEGEVEIIDATLEVLEGSYIAEPFDVTDLLGTEELIAHQNEYVSFKTMKIEPSVDAEGNEVAFLYGWDGSGTAGDDLYFNVSVEGEVYNFVVESYLTGDGTDVYEAIEAIQIGEFVDMEGYLYWYAGVNPHITSVTVSERFASVDAETEAAIDAYLQGTWEYTDNGINYACTFEGGSFYVTSEISGTSISNEGSYKICKEVILVTYSNGNMAYMEYEWDGAEVTLYYLTGM